MSSLAALLLQALIGNKQSQTAENFQDCKGEIQGAFMSIQLKKLVHLKSNVKIFVKMILQGLFKNLT